MDGASLVSQQTANEPQDTFDFGRTDCEIARLDRHISNLLAFRAYICRPRNRHICINRLPFEVLAEIFLLSSMARRLEEGQEQPTVFPLTLGSICHRWRCVAWASSELWASLHCRISKARYNVQVSLLREWLERSQERLLSICISIKDEDTWVESNDLSTAILDILIPHSERWEYLGLVLPGAWYRKLNQAQGRVPNLISLAIRPPGCKSPLLPFRAFAHATSIRHLFAAYYHLANIHLRWDLLETVILENLTTKEAVEIIRRCRNLTSCRLNGLGAVENFLPSMSTNHSLKILELSLNEMAGIQGFLNFLVLPGLCVLAMTLPEGHVFPIPAIEALMARSACPLKVLEINGVDIHQADLIDFLSSHDSLTTIRVSLRT
ncbi:hypothetical protein CVT26_013243 [Gymnopilus dilepis]|uniref:F-box domain-containing protein n=1 Tax=Gymnopilus dilepis TaxID=231916 RepID=A0A409WV82_9AGAR|nr:hypothetical protein CVT26_013243 [Gymnopilus dilepis]